MKVKALADEMELRCSIERMARMYASADQEAVEPAWTPEWRAEMAEQTRCVRLKIEREVAEYLARKYGCIVEAASEVSAAHRAAADVPTEQAA